MTHAELARKTGLSETTVRRRRSKGMTDEEIINTPKMSATQAARMGKSKSPWRNGYKANK